ncbi:sialate O-acetylesterase [Marinoscillum furvescens]|uniref:Sialate O-acetylesterase n=1 Tax=Marinoscillum furvescens DSM 4134 TaxID=1122208 RepID=A0A3D9L6F6_MARFU|nr:sialate O-acetylesterase [Marinoscillum furvescens]REE01054.1 sialate O-acetylesterase [Marinoscillum furvescens DSM 4134]
MLRIVSSIFFLLLSLASTSQLKLPQLISNGMVLQRDTPLTLWGWDTPGHPVSVELDGVVYLGKTKSDSSWRIQLPPQKAGGPYTTKITGSQTILLEDVWIGDVWLASGQSNMDLTIERVSPIYQTEIENADFSQIRYFQVPNKYHFNEPLSDLEGGQWTSTTPENVLKFSAVAYFFAQALHQSQGVPIGIIKSSLGGSPAQAWMSEDALKAFPSHFEEAQIFKDQSVIDSLKQADATRKNNWYATSTAKDRWLQSSPDWHSNEVKANNWPTMMVPGYWTDQNVNFKNGVVWFKRNFTLPADCTGQAAYLELGCIVDADSTFVNGHFVGNTTYRYPPRRYQIPAGVLTAGENTLTVRVVNTSGRGGFVPDKNYQISCQDQTIDLSGTWHYQLGAEMQPLARPTFIRWKPLGLYNAMIAPLTSYTIRGAIWYQGESNTSNPQEYRKLLPAMIEDWRSQWGYEFPFLIVQLANYMEPADAPGPSNWAMLREAQLLTAQNTPNTALTVTIDLGEWNDVHPLRKKPVGERLARAARKLSYDEDIIASGPVYQQMQVKKGKIILTFDQDKLVARGGPLRAFAIAGANRQFVWAEAQIKGNQITVWSDKVPKPVAVRYAWAHNPNQTNLYNEAGLPASPFRTDNWKE